MAHPVAFDSMQLKKAELNYAIHEKEMLAIIQALKKWRSNLLGSHIYIYTDHPTLENFNAQWDLSCRQLHWQEFLSQYNMTITYIHGKDNTVADALSRVPPNAFPDELGDEVQPHEHWIRIHSVNVILSITADRHVLNNIITSYKHNEFCKRLPTVGMKGIKCIDKLWYIEDQLIVPRYGNIHENLFRLAHDNLGHFGADKSYAALRGAYYWPNMRCDLEKAYLPSCTDCLRNKSHTTKPPGPLHPLPIPDKHGDSVAIDFIGPLLPDSSHDCIISMTDHLNSDICIILSSLHITAEEFALIFFLISGIVKMGSPSI